MIVSKYCLSIGEHVVIIFVTQYVTIATVSPANNTLNYTYGDLYCQLLISIKAQHLAKFKTNSVVRVQSHLKVIFPYHL